MDWLTSFRLGKMTLADALFFHLSETGADPALIESYSMALSDYQEGKYSDLAEGFGIAMTNRQKHKIQKSIEDNVIKELVEELARGERVARVVNGKIIEEIIKEPLSKTLPSDSKNIEKPRKPGAYEEVGNRLKPIKGADAIRDICRNKKKTEGGGK